jgi:hypothetical protein
MLALTLTNIGLNVAQKVSEPWSVASRALEADPSPKTEILRVIRAEYVPGINEKIFGRWVVAECYRSVARGSLHAPMWAPCAGPGFGSAINRLDGREHLEAATVKFDRGPTKPARWSRRRRNSGCQSID